MYLDDDEIDEMNTTSIFLFSLNTTVVKKEPKDVSDKMIIDVTIKLCYLHLSYDPLMFYFCDNLDTK